MKIYSADTITRSEVDAIDVKQTQQIKQLRTWLAVSFAINLVVAVGAYLFKM